MNQPRSPPPPPPPPSHEGRPPRFTCDDDGRTCTRPRSNGNGARRPRARLLSSGGHVVRHVHCIRAGAKTTAGREVWCASADVPDGPSANKTAPPSLATLTPRLLPQSGDPFAPPAVRVHFCRDLAGQNLGGTRH